jgi:cyclic pyranopterin phosphate synthase
MAAASPPPGSLIDGFGRRITYLRISVTDRCDLRCRYCMAEDMRFLPPKALMAIDEIVEIADAFIDRGVRRIRLTGGEPLVRRGATDLARRLGERIGAGLDELTLTTNATRLAAEAQMLFDAGIRRINVSLDSRDPERFRHITRTGDVARVLDGIAAAQAVGMQVKINMVALKGLNEDEIEPMLRWCAAQRLGLTLIETMPLGDTGEDRTDRYLPLDAVRRTLERRYTLVPLTERTGGPARYAGVAELDTKIGFITPLTENFCAGCNRVRLTAEGHLYLCLGREDRIDLRAALRAGGRGGLDEALDRAMMAKPAAHDFRIERGGTAAVTRHMSVTGG